MRGRRKESSEPEEQEERECTAYTYAWINRDTGESFLQFLSEVLSIRDLARLRLVPNVVWRVVTILGEGRKKQERRGGNIISSSNSLHKGCIFSYIL